MFKAYRQKITEMERRGDAREESYYPILKELIEQLSISLNRSEIYVTPTPRRTEGGNPDFRIWSGKHRIIGYIEVKTPDCNLESVEDIEQIQRYKDTFANFILTNLDEFRLYKDGILIGSANIPTGSSSPLTENEEVFIRLFDIFFSYSIPSISSAQQLAVELAKRTRFLRDAVIVEEIGEESRNGGGIILGFYEAFQKYLIRGLTKEEFADLYSQTITYGLFSARMRCEGEFNRRLAVDDIPHSIGILKEIFEYISLGDLPPQLEWIVDEITNVLTNVDVRRMFSEYFHERRGEDPVFHFYETFLEEYDPEEREKRGVYYTPQPVVYYIVKSLHILLKEKFGLPDGLASGNVTILDPAGGTLTFLAETIKLTVNEFIEKYGEGGKDQFIREHVLKNFYAFELMVAPYAIGHLKISFILQELGYRLKENERIKFYITNTLEKEEIEQTALPGMASLSEESKKAGEVKNKIPILVILGNPPYSGISANMGEWISGLIEDYKYVDGKHFGEKKHWLHDDYVKFIRFAEWKINQNNKGVIGYITNHSYIDNTTFRGMRQHLMNTFNEIYVLDLHGNSLKKEKCPDGSKDENVFDIRQGVAISFFVKHDTSISSKVFHSEVWGLREKKYSYLTSKDITTTKWQELQPHTPSYYFIPREEQYQEIYMKYWKITDILLKNSVTIVTSRDDFVTDFDKNALKNRIEIFRNLSIPDKQIRQQFGLDDTSSFNLKESREILAQNKNWEDYFTKIQYRPFVVKDIYYSGAVVERPLWKIMQHMMKKNLALLAMRQVSLDKSYTHFFITDCIVDNRAFLSSKGILQIFPLYLHKNTKIESNVSPELLKLLEKTYGKQCTIEEIFYYVYGIVYSNIYRIKYSQFLRTDFPRVPFTSEYELFSKIGNLGEKLVELHLMKSNDLNNLISRFHGEGENKVEKPLYGENEKRVYINATQYFDGIEKDVWEYQIGGYQVLLKYLTEIKKNAGSKLSLANIKHYCKIVTALKITQKIQKEIDKLYPKVEKKIIEYKEPEIKPVTEYKQYLRED